MIDRIPLADLDPIAALARAAKIPALQGGAEGIASVEQLLALIQFADLSPLIADKGTAELGVSSTALMTALGVRQADIYARGPLTLVHDLAPEEGAGSTNTAKINDAIAAAAARGGGLVLIPDGAYRIGQILMRPGVHLTCAHRHSATLRNDDANGSSLIKAHDDTVSNRWMAVTNLRLMKPAATGGAIINALSWQFCEISDNWITSSSALGTAGIQLGGRYTTGPLVFSTEGTYNRVLGNYIGLCAFGVRFGPNANTCWAMFNRVQPAVNGGMGFLVGPDAAGVSVGGFPNQVTIAFNSVETIGVSNVRGVRIEPAAHAVAVFCNRFEGSALIYGIEIQDGATGWAFANYAEGVGTPVLNLSAAFVEMDRRFSRSALVSASGAAVDFTGLPKGVNRVTVNFLGVSTNGSSRPTIQLGDSGGIETSGYSGVLVSLASAQSVGAAQLSSGFSTNPIGAAETAHGCVTLVRLGGNVWSAMGGVGAGGALTGTIVFGTKELSAELDRIRISAGGSDTFDAGQIAVTWE